MYFAKHSARRLGATDYSCGVVNDVYYCGKNDKSGNMFEVSPEVAANFINAADQGKIVLAQDAAPPVAKPKQAAPSQGNFLSNVTPTQMGIAAVGLFAAVALVAAGGR